MQKTSRSPKSENSLVSVMTSVRSRVFKVVRLFHHRSCLNIQGIVVIYNIFESFLQANINFVARAKKTLWK